MKSSYSSVVGQKFDNDGKVSYFPGNSVIAMVDVDSLFFKNIMDIQNDLKSLSFADQFTFLPMESFHMTVFDLLCDKVREKKRWSRFLSLDVPFLECDKYFIKLFNELEEPPSFRMKFTSMYYDNVLYVKLVPVDMSVDKNLKEYRDLLSFFTGVRHPNHTSYFFHISLAYLVKIIDKNQKSELNSKFLSINKRYRGRSDMVYDFYPKLKFFNDMFSFNLTREIFESSK